MKTLDPILIARKKLCLELAEEIIRSQQRSYKFYSDETNLAKLIELWLPSTYAEAVAEMQMLEDEEDIPKLSGPSLLDRLRDALDCHGQSLTTIALLEIAILKLEKCKKEQIEWQL